MNWSMLTNRVMPENKLVNRPKSIKVYFVFLVVWRIISPIIYSFSSLFNLQTGDGLMGLI